MTEPPAARPALRLPDSFRARAVEVLAGRAEPAVPRDAATVMLLRPAAGGLEVYLLRRRSSMAFAPGAVVFPGGGVDPRDADADIAWAGPDPAAWGAMIDAPAQLARELVCAAVRETFEESGVLLAGPSADTIVADTRGDEWEAGRQALLDRTLSLAGFLSRHRLVLRSDLLRPWARWVTPVTEERRYDTRFFAAELPAGQLTRDVGGEADQVAWLAPGAAIEAARRREIFLLPPTAVTLAELAACGTVAEALATRRRITTRIPEVSIAEGAVWLSMPDELEYPL